MIEAIGEKRFLDEVLENDGIWVAMNGAQVYAQKAGEGVTLFAWSNKENTDTYIKQSGMSDLVPVSVPVKTFVVA